MQLRYFKFGNFGDALNPHIFHHFFPSFFDDDPSIDFIGIGSILGFDMANEAPKKIIFSSGFAYGKKPFIDDSFDVISVRGPLTARELKLDPKLAIIDGAVLIREMIKQRPEKKYRFSFMPHWESELKFDWEKVCEAADIKYISPAQDINTTLVEIMQSEIILAEAMHAAIVADALRVPWIPVKAYPGINDFKWTDFTSSVDLPYSPHTLPSLFEDTDFVVNISKKKISSKIPKLAYRLGLKGYTLFQKMSTLPQAKKAFEAIKKQKPMLSSDAVLNGKVDQLLEKIAYVKQKYS